MKIKQINLNFMNLIFWIILGAILLLIIWIIAVYNSLVTLKNRVKEAWSDIDIQLKRRYNLIPNLIETVKAYAKHERETFEKVTQARNLAVNAEKSGNLEEIGKAENMLAGTLKSLFAVAENYPDLKANQNFLQLQDELTDTENKVQASRRFYNGNVRDFNTKIQQFPNNLIAQTFKFSEEKFFALEEEKEREVPRVKF